MEKFTMENVEAVFWLDKDTLVMDFVPETDESGDQFQLEVEYWADNDEWHYNDILLDEDGERTECLKRRLTEEEQGQIQELMKPYIEKGF